MCKELDRRVKEHQGDRDVYKAYLKDLDSQTLPAMGEELDEQAELELEQQINALQAERRALAAENQQLDAEEEQLEQFEKRFWNEML